MRRSTDRIITSHVGALPRSTALAGQYASKMDADGSTLEEAIEHVVAHQVGTGIDLVNDGEYSKFSFIQYAADRLSGYAEVSVPDDFDAGAVVAGRDLAAFPRYYGDRGGVFPFKVKPFGCQGDIAYVGQQAVQADISNLKAALSKHSLPASDGFLTAISPITLDVLLPNLHYGTDDEYLQALADALHDEYKAITDAGLNVQIDDPGLAHAWQKRPDWSVADCRRFCESRVEALNYALRDCPSEQVRIHVCWGSFHGPHATDLGLEHFIDILYRANAQCYSIEGANPRHEHEWAVFRDHPLPDGKSIMAGVVAHATDTVEHPLLVAQRLERWASVLGRENIIAGTDCGLARVHNEICWAKLQSMVEGAEIASSSLWS